MMMKKIFAFFIAILCCSSISAVVFQKIHLKNGSVLNGYIESLNKNGEMIVCTDNAVICLGSQDVSVSETKRAYNTLNAEWKNWGEKNDALAADDRGLVLSNVMINGSHLEDTASANGISASFEQRLKNDRRSFYDVRILEKGANIKFLELTPNKYNVTWADIKTIKSDKRARNVLSGLVRTYQMANNRTVTGEYAGETAGTVSVWQSEGYAENLNFDEINSVTIAALNPQQDIMEQTPLYDVVYKKNSRIPLKGLIVEYNYAGKSLEECFITVKRTDGYKENVKMSDIVSLAKEENKDCVIKTDIILNPGEVRVNRDTVSYAAVSEITGNILHVADDAKLKKVEGKNGTPTRITVEYYSAAGSNVEVFQLVKVVKTMVKKKPSYNFSYKDLVNKEVKAKTVETSVNHTTKVDYEVNGTGVYALYDSQAKRAILIDVVP